MNDYKNLKVWQRAVELAVTVYKVTTSFPREEIYGLTSQVRRCVVSISSNIAEGSRRSSQKEFLQFLSIAQGSSYESHTQILIANKIGPVDKQLFDELTANLIEIIKITSGLKNSLRKHLNLLLETYY